MSAIKKIKEKYRKFFFRRELKKITRHKKVINYFDAKNIGIIYDASIEENYLLITSFTKELQQEGKKVNTLGYIRQKKKPEYSFPKLIFGFFSSEDFKWNYKYKSNYVKEFVESEFDILIDFSPDDIFLAKYVAGLSKACYKVGTYSEDYYNIYDLLIEVSKSCTLEELMEHSVHYLKTINSQKTYA